MKENVITSRKKLFQENQNRRNLNVIVFDGEIYITAFTILYKGMSVVKVNVVPVTGRAGP
jgi:hypothetical protein